MADAPSFIGFRVNEKVMTNRWAADYLNRLFIASMDAVGVVDKDTMMFVSESESRRKGYGFPAGEGCVRSVFDIDGGGLDHKIKWVLVVGFDEFFDDAREDEPVDAYHFLCTVAAIDHEVRHVYQHTVLERSGTELGRLFFLNQWSMYDSHAFSDEIYAQNVNEIDAQYFALKRLGVHITGLKGFELVGIERTDDGFVDKGAPDEYARNTPVDTALCFYQAKRHENVEHDFIDYPKGGFKSANRHSESSTEKSLQQLLSKKPLKALNY